MDRTVHLVSFKDEWDGKLSVLIPLFNEEGTIGLVLEKVLALGDVLKEIIVVDDGSTDASPTIVQAIAEYKPLLRFFRLDYNQGKTAAIRHALVQATGDILIIQDADLEYDPAEIPKVIAPILAGQADVVYGSRFLRSRTAHVLSSCHYLANIGLTWFSNLLTRRHLTDIETCYKAFRAGVIKPLQLSSRGFGLEVEITALISQTNARTCEVPISYHGRSYQEGKKIGFWDGVMAGLYIFWFNLIQAHLPSARRYRHTVNTYLEQQPAAVEEMSLSRAA